MALYNLELLQEALFKSFFWITDVTKQFVFLFILLSLFMSGCEDATTQTTTTATQQVSTTPKPAVVKETKKKPFVSKKRVKNKPSQPEIEEDLDESDLSNEIQILDLSVPTQYNEAIIPEESSGDNREANLLPDLFVDKKNQKKNSVQVDGSFISRQEEEVEKSKTVDGIGIDITLTP